ncbi:phosphatidylserine decarboxylase [Bacillus marasmi]|uniref:phosphatidylserine decarboxylase n=1 Tax=Bacillus marasmi TaxID=1926279 RepID=UPI0011C895FA|nr:phosphatidylserine decarboxylase [Bacillus marasmi]
MISALYRILIELTNGRLTSAILKRFATSQLSRFIIPSFAKVYNLNLKEMEKNLNEFSTLHDLFTRRLKRNARSHDPATNIVSSPVDGVLEDFGIINKSNEITVKGKSYSIGEMLGSDEVLAKYLEGTYMIIYLSPSNYHRIHSPIGGEITEQWTLGRKSYPVNKHGLKYGRRPLSKNYRRISEIKHDFGHMAVVKVGAMFVNSIEIVHEGSKIAKGEELAYFTFGSTVVLLFEKNSFTLNPDLKPPSSVVVGQKLGELVKRDEKK